MKAVLVIDIPDKYAERYNVNEMYVWSLPVSDKRGYEMFDLTTDKPNHLKPLPKGHGRLKDIDKVERLLDLDKPDNILAKGLKTIIESVPTIIEADTGDEK